MSTELTAFGARLRQARLQFGARRNRDVSKEEAGRAVGVTGAAYGRWEAGGKEPSLATIRKLADWLGVSMGWLASGEGDMRPPVEAPPATATRPKRRPIPKPDPASVEGPPVTPTVPRRASGDGR